MMALTTTEILEAVVKGRSKILTDVLLRVKAKNEKMRAQS